ncbi:hypothetical protein MMC13_006188 [Lambiella insularis]|nr:hypothetical protein [Lambiella insularis]
MAQRSSRTSIFSRPSFNASTESLKRKSTLNGVTGSSRPTDIKRWDGSRRITTSWDSIRRDPELWFPSGDCLVHFYERGQSRRGASLRLLLADIESSNCRPLLELCCARPVPESPTETVSSSSDDGGYFSNPSAQGKYELYIPAPPHLNREEALQYHLTTRNFFAWMFEKPVVGYKLGDALASLLDRMNEYRPDSEENQDDILAYIDSLSYSDFRDCPDHALAALNFAEAFEIGDLWTDAFVHCSGMNDDLVSSTEFSSISKTTKALITRAHLEMDIRLERASKSLGTFLEDEIPGSHVGLPFEAQKHLERFRSFLHSFYVQKTGYWPPTGTTRKRGTFSNSTFRAMYFDFRSLYEYLVDPTFSAHMALSDPTAGGIYGVRATSSFDRRHKYTTLPHPLPLVPEVSYLSSLPKASSLSRLFSNNKQSKADRRMASLCALSAATNCSDVKVMENALVREYFRFERETALREEEKISACDGRQIRWILIYSILQILISVTRAPSEVRDTEGVDYPLCCQIAGTPPWNIGKVLATLPPKKSTLRPIATGSSTANSTILSLHPALRPSGPGLSSTPPPRRLLTRTHSAPNLRASINASVALPPPTPLVPTIATPLVVRHPQPRKPFCEILINSYGNGRGTSTPIHDVDPSSFPLPQLSTTESDSDPETPSSGTSAWSVHSTSIFDVPDAELASTRNSPSIYSEGGEVEPDWARMGRDLARGMDGQRRKSREILSSFVTVHGIGYAVDAGNKVKGKASVGSFAWARCNPEVERYVSS